MTQFSDSAGRVKHIRITRDYPHGTRQRYITGCKCVPCRAANSRYSCERDRLKRLGLNNPLVPATRARNHLRKLVVGGMGQRRIQEVSGFNRSLIRPILLGQKKRIRRETQDRILRISIADHTLAPGQLIDASETWQLLDEMIALGFPKSWIATQMYGQATPSLQLKRDRVKVRSATAVRELYWKLHSRDWLTAEMARLVRLSRHKSSRDRIARALLAGQSVPRLLEDVAQ